ncbi:DUF1772 domain-containing protein [uncultured Photobacterium sp.]|uniref:DUF1772 domain-containing protein n=1 Tax=uncultured Photobacterium sp. TaxID=173973 RepID=UPI00261D675E|nr:DUF1772 domain-containing protein [uncultured Photobacterium sp.]
MFEILILSIILGMSIIFGVALAALVVVHPILLTVSRQTAIEFFKPFFHRTHILVLSLSLVVTILALVASFVSSNWWWFGIALIMHINGPYTYLRMMPTNNRLMADDIDVDSEQTRNDLNKWGRLHAVRTMINGIVFIGFVVLALYSSVR